VRGLAWVMSGPAALAVALASGAFLVWDPHSARARALPAARARLPTLAPATCRYPVEPSHFEGPGLAVHVMPWPQARVSCKNFYHRRAPAGCRGAGCLCKAAARQWSAALAAARGEPARCASARARRCARLRGALAQGLWARGGAGQRARGPVRRAARGRHRRPRRAQRAAPHRARARPRGGAPGMRAAGSVPGRGRL